MTVTSRNPRAASSPTILPGVDASTLTRGLYSTDASLYRIVPEGVATPRDADELAALVDAALAAGVPLTLRGAGTSCAGNAVGPGVAAKGRRRAKGGFQPGQILGFHGLARHGVLGN